MLAQAHSHTLLKTKLDSSLSVHGLSLTEFVIIKQLHQSPEQAMSRIALANAIGLKASEITRLLAPMSKNNIVDKALHAEDVRESLVSLTETGMALYTDALISFEYSCNSAFSSLNDTEVAQLLAVFNKING